MGEEHGDAPCWGGYALTVTGPMATGFVLGLAVAVPLVYLAARHTRRRMARLQETSAANERLAELGTLAGGLAHEIKNPLSSVNLNIQLLQEDLDQVASAARAGRFDDQEVTRIQRRFQTLGAETQRLRDILEDFLRFAGRLKLQREPTDLNRLVDEVADFFAAQAQAAEVNIRTKLDARPASAAVDGDLLKQALLNLTINAVNAMTGAREKGVAHGGATELILRTHRSRALGRESIEIHVTDTGPGMDAVTRERVFEPYFSTRRGGTGLGLPTARRIVEEHGGRLTVHAEAGRGCDFVIALPVGAGLPEA